MRRKVFGLVITCCVLTGGAIWGYYTFLWKRPYLEIPIGFCASKVPYLRVEIEGNPYHLLLDTGMSGHMELRREILDKIPKEPYGEITFYEVNDNQHVVQSYIVDGNKITFGKGYVKGKLLVREGLSEEQRITTPFRIPKYHSNVNCSDLDGILGGKLLRTLRILYDFEHSRIVLTRGEHILPLLNKKGYRTEKLAPVEAFIEEDAVLLVNTDFGTRRFILDTGTSVNLIRPECFDMPIAGDAIQKIKTEKCISRGIDLGPEEFYLFDFASKFEADGILGADFFHRHLVYIDCIDKKVMIAPQQE